MLTTGKFTRKAAVLAFCFLILSVTSEYVSIAHAQSNPVTFDLSFGWLSGTMDASFSIAGGSVNPGHQKDSSCSLTTSKLTLSLSIPNVGSSSMQVDVLGNHEYAIPGLQYNYLVAKLALYLTFEGSIDGQLTADNNATLSTTQIQWTQTGSQPFSLTSPNQVSSGTVITVTLSDITYHIKAGVKAEGDLLGNHQEFTLIDNTELGSIQASPSQISKTFNIVSPSSLDIAGIALWIGAAVTIGLCSTVGALLFKERGKARKAGLGSQNQVGHNCSACGSANTATAKFCRKCGKKL
jgi:hypothetical protein